MSIQRVRAYLAPYGAAERIREFEVSSATVELAARAAGVEPGRIAKSLGFKLEGRTILVVAAGDVRIDNAKYKACFGGKAAMLTPDEAVEVCLDQSLRRFETVLPAAGSANSCIELTLEELERFARTTRWVDVCRPRQ